MKRCWVDCFRRGGIGQFEQVIWGSIVEQGLEILLSVRSLANDQPQGGGIFPHEVVEEIGFDVSDGLFLRVMPFKFPGLPGNSFDALMWKGVVALFNLFDDERVGHDKYKSQFCSAGLGNTTQPHLPRVEYIRSGG